MTLDNEAVEVKREFRSIRRTGMVCIVLLAGTLGGLVQSDNRTAKILERMPEQTLYTENVSGNETPDKFYLVNGQRAYLEIDGQPVESYIPKTPAEMPVIQPTHY